MRDSFSLARERFRFHGPAEGFGHGPVKVGDELFDLGAQVLFGSEIAAAKEFADQDREPNFYLIEP